MFLSLRTRIGIGRSSTNCLSWAQEREPGWTCRIRVRPVMNTENAANNILVDLYAKSHRDLLGDSRATPTGIPPLHFHDGVDEFLLRSLRAGATPALGREQRAVLSVASVAGGDAATQKHSAR